jgi:hypothetical protein
MPSPKPSTAPSQQSLPELRNRLVFGRTGAAGGLGGDVAAIEEPFRGNSTAVPLRQSLHDRVPKGALGYARGLSLSIKDNVPAYGFSIVATSGVLVANAEIHAATLTHALAFLLGATAAFGLVGALAAFAFEEERIEEASPQTVFIGSVLSVFSTCAGFGAAVLTAWLVHGWAGWFLTAFCSTIAYVLVLALELDLAARLRRSGRLTPGDGPTADDAAPRSRARSSAVAK